MQSGMSRRGREKIRMYHGGSYHVQHVKYDLHNSPFSWDQNVIEKKYHL
jgi:hypothetical protein